MKNNTASLPFASHTGAQPLSRAARGAGIAARIAGLGLVVAGSLTLGTGALAADLQTQTAGPFTYVCGGVGEDEQQALRSQARNYDMGLLFTQGGRGEYLSDVDVTLSRGGKEVASFRSSGPRCLLKGPKGTYQVKADYMGTTKRATLSAGQRNLQMRW